MGESLHPCPFFRKKWLNKEDQNHNDSQDIAWRHLLEVSGENLWSIRKQAAGQQKHSAQCIEWQEDSVKGIFCLPLNPANPQTKYVAVVTSVDQFLCLEQKHGMDKMHSLRNQNPYRPLTQTLGHEWVRARRLFKSALGSNFQQKSLKAVQMVELDQLLFLQSAKPQSTEVLDLLHTIRQISVQWIVALLQGCPSPKIENAVSRYWTLIRGRDACHPCIEARARRAVLKELDWEKEGSLLQSLAKCGFSQKEQQDNALNVLSAALDAIQCLLFWTVWNLSHDDDTILWKTCQDEWKQSTDQNNNSQYSHDLEILADFKKRATQGEAIILDGKLSLLGRALAETVRVYPPIWTLPRRWPTTAEEEQSFSFSSPPTSSNIISAKADVLSINGATDRASWDLNRREPCHVASFGLGERSCPAGTAALVAAYHVLHRMVTCWERPHWLAPEHALTNAYLGPSLCVEGPQKIRVRPCCPID